MSAADSAAGDAPASTPVWRSGRLDARRGRGRLLFGRVYEDSAIERAAFARGGRVFCIASAGCTALALAHEHEVVACDVNPAQLAYARRRIAGAPRETGSAERILGLLRALAPLAGWSRRELELFLACDDPARQLDAWRSRFDTRRFRAGMDLCFSPLALAAAYAPPLRSCLPHRFGAVLRGRMQRCFGRHPNRDNPYARALLLGGRDVDDPARRAPPPGRIELVGSDAAAWLETCRPASFTGFSLSNILDGAGETYRVRLFAAVRRAATPGAPVVLRSFAEPSRELAVNRAADDRSFLWGVVEVRAAQDL